ncbi:MAG: hypothetical protein HQM08_01955 [Candidatus Riflebacteria bacterium]|nr:hypothetical protein [Candidatus Riflebacteria bacterium]
MPFKLRQRLIMSILFLVTFTVSLFGQVGNGFFRNLILKRVEEKSSALQVDAKRETLIFNGKARSYYVHAPKGWDRKDQLPLVFLFHGGGGNAKQALGHYQLISKSDQAGFLLVAPNGTGPREEIFLTWNVGFGFGEAFKQNIDDVGFFRVLLAKIEHDFPISPDKIFATGISNGAILCHLLAAQPDNQIAAIAPVVGTLGGMDLTKKVLFVPPKPTSPVSVMLINGLLDDHIPIEGGLQKKSIQEPRIVSSASQTVNFWVQANECDSTPDYSFDGKLKTAIYKYSKGKNDTGVILYILQNQGHAWPGSTQTNRLAADKPSPDFPGNDMIWEFFKSHPGKSKWPDSTSSVFPK